MDPEPSEPTNPDLWGTDPFYDTNLSDRPRRAPALMAVALAVVVTAVIGAIGWMFGTGSADTSPQTVYRTEQRESTVTETVTKPGKGKTSYRTTTETARPALLPAPTVYVTSPARPAPVVTKTVTVRVTATVRVTQRIEVPGPVITVTEEVQASVNGDLPAE